VQALEHPEDPLAVRRLDPDAVVGHEEAPARAVAAGADPDAGRRARPGELDGVGDEVLEELGELQGVAAHGRQRVHLHRGLGLVEPVLQVGEDVGDDEVAVDLGELLLGAADAGVGEQAFDQRPHPGAPVDGVADEPVGLGVQPALVAAGEQLDVAGDGPERLGQVVGGDVGELLQLGVGLAQLLGLLGQLTCGAPLLGHVDEGGQRVRHGTGLVADRGELHPERTPPVRGEHLDVVQLTRLASQCLPDPRPLGRVELVGAGNIGLVDLGEVLWSGVGVDAVPQQLEAVAVGVDRLAGRVDHEDPDRQPFEELDQAVFAVLQTTLRGGERPGPPFELDQGGGPLGLDPGERTPGGQQHGHEQHHHRDDEQGRPELGPVHPQPLPAQAQPAEQERHQYGGRDQAAQHQPGLPGGDEQPRRPGVDRDGDDP
jgi:hypothetical protein